jgi:hypothetical protein
MSHRLMILSLLALLAASGCSTSGSSLPAASATQAPPSVPATAAIPSAPIPSPAASATSPSPGASVPLGPTDFTTIVDNPWFPLIPGTTLTHRGTRDGEKAVNVFKVTDRTKVVDGVTCVVVDDRLYLDGIMAERTNDYYVQDRNGNVWYYGEDTAELDKNGKVVSREGTWHAGVDGATPGIFMEANPVVGHTYIQELYVGHAEDHFEVLSTSASVTVPFGSFSGVVQTKEWTPLEPAVLDNKYYVKGIGEVLETSVKGPVEKLELVKVQRP